MKTSSPSYFRVLLTFLRNSFIVEMTFRGNFFITVLTRSFFFFAQLALFEIIFRSLGPTGNINGWTRPEYFVFMSTGMLINSIVETFFMPNCGNFSEMIRTGNLDFILVKPIDSQFLVSFEKINFAMLSQAVFSVGLLIHALQLRGTSVSMHDVIFFLVFVANGVMFFYSLMITLASTSIFFVRNQSLYDFWFYVTVFARYPRSIYSGSALGELIQSIFTYVVPILLIVTVPARVLLAKLDDVHWKTSFLLVGLLAAIVGLFLSRLIFQWSLNRYRSASS